MNGNDNKRLRELYNNLINDNYELPDYGEFERDMADDAKMRELYGNIKSDNYDVPDYGTFRSDMGFVTQQQDTENGDNGSRGLSVSSFTPGFVGQNDRVRAPFANAEAERKYEREKFKSEMDKKVPAMKQSAESFGERSDQQMKNINKGFGLDKKTAEVYNPETGETETWTVFGGRKEEVYNPTTGKNEPRYYTMGGNHTADLLEQADENLRIMNADAWAREHDKAQVKSLSDEIDRNVSAIQQQAIDEWRQKEEGLGFWGKVGHALQGAEDPSKVGSDLTQMYANHPEMVEWQAAKRAITNAQRVIDEADHNAREGKFESTFVAGLGRGFGQKFSDVSTWDLGISDLNDNGAIFRALADWEEGKELTPSQQALLDAKVVELATMEYFGSELGRGYKAGQTTAESLPFMIEMIANPISATVEGAAKAMAKYALKRFAGKAVKKGLKKAVTYGAATLVRQAGAIGTGLGMTATTGSISVAADATRRMTATPTGEYDEKGELHFNDIDDSEVEDPMTAWLKAGGARAISYYAENVFPEGGNMFGRFLSKTAKTKAGKKFGIEHVNNYFKKVAKSQAGKTISEIEKKARWGGFPAEAAEEFVEGGVNASIIGDSHIRGKDGKIWGTTDKDALFSQDNLIDTTLGVGVMSVMFPFLKTMGYGFNKVVFPKIESAVYKRKARKAMARADEEGIKAFGGNQMAWDIYHNPIAFGNEEEVKAAIRKSLSDEELTDEQKMAVWNYAIKTQGYRGVENFMDELMKDTDPTAEDALNSYVSCYENATTVEQRNYIHKFYNETVDKLRGMIDEETMSRLEADPVGVKSELEASGKLSDEVRETVADFVAAKASMDGITDRINHDAEAEAEAKRQANEPLRHVDDGSIIKATMSVDGKEKEVYVKRGKVVLTDDGTTVDKDKSDQTVTVYDTDTGTETMVDPSALIYTGTVTAEEQEARIENEMHERIEAERAAASGAVVPGKRIQVKDGVWATIEAVQNGEVSFTQDDGQQGVMPLAEAQNLSDAAAQTTYDEIRSQSAQNKQREEKPAVEEVFIEQAPERYEPGMTVKLRNSKGEEKVVTVKQPVKLGAGFKFVPDADGKYIEYEENGKTERAGGMTEWKIVGWKPEEQPAEELAVPAAETSGEVPKYQLSDEVDENGRQFVLTSDGNIEFGQVDAESGLTAAPILLSEGVITNPQTNDGYGLIHIEARHGDQIRKAGYKSVLDFIEKVAKNYDIIMEGKDRNGSPTYRLILTDEHNNTLMVELSGDGTYWNINTAGIFKHSYGANMNIVYSRHTTANQSAETGGASLSGAQSGTTPSTSMNAPTQSGGKDTKNIPTDQIKNATNGESERPSVETPQQLTPEAYTPEQYVTQPAADPDAMPMHEETRGSGKNAVTEMMPDWYAVTPERAHRYLYDELGFTPDVADATVQANMDEVARAISGHSKAEPKPTANPLAYKAAHDAWQEQMKALQEQQRYWEEVQAVQQAAVRAEKEFFGEMDVAVPEWLQNKVKEARGNRKALLMQAVEEMGNDPEALAELENEEPMTLEEVAAWALVNGAKLMRSDEKLGASVVKGLSSMSGYDNAEFKRFPGLFAKRSNGGMGVDEFGEIVARRAGEFGIAFDEQDAMAGTNALLELFSQAQTKGDIIDYILKNRIESAKNIHDRTINLRNERFKENNGVSIEEYIAEDVFWKEVAADLAAMTDEEYEYIKSSEYYDEGRTGSNIGAPEATEKRTGPEIGEPETAESGAVVDNGRSRMENGGDSESKEEGGQGNVRPQVSGDTHNAVGEGAGREGAAEGSTAAEPAAVEQPQTERVDPLEQAEGKFLDIIEVINWEYGTNYGWDTLKSFLRWASSKAKAKKVSTRKFVGDWFRDKLSPKDAKNITDTIFTALNAAEEQVKQSTTQTEQPAAVRETREQRDKRLEEERRQRILDNGTLFDEPFGLVPVSVTMTAEDIENNVQRIVQGLKDNEGTGNLDGFYGFAYNGAYKKNAGHQVDQYLFSLSGVIPQQTLAEWYDRHGLKTQDDLQAYGEKLYTETEKTEQQASTDDLYQRHYDAAVKEIESILDGVERGEGVVVSPEMTDAIQKIADIGEEAGRRLEDSTLPEDERVRLQAQYDATDKWLDENVRGEVYTVPARKEGEDMVDYAERVAKGLEVHEKLTKRKKSTNKKKSVSLQSENEPDLFSGIEEAAPSEAATAEQSEPVEATAPKKVGNKIEDVGEKIGGARKDLAQQMSSKINLDADTFPKMFPKFDLKKMVEQGLDPKLASAVYFLRMTAQEEYKRNAKKNTKQSALGSAKFFAAYAKRFLENGDTNTDFTDNGWGFTEYGKKFIDCNLVLFDKVHDKLGDDIFDLDLSGYAIYPVERNSYSHYYRKNEQGETVEIHPSYNARAKFSTSSYYMEDELDKAVDELTDKIAESVSYKASHPYKLVHYYTPGQKDSSYVGVKLGGKIVALTDKMNSSELQKYLNEHEAELQEKARLLDEERKQGKKEGGDGRWKPELNLGGMRSRVGDDYRNGRDITADEFRDTFGFRGVEFGNYVNQTERQKFLNEAYDALLDMAKLLDVSPKALSLGGQLAFAIGARGGGKAAAHYEPELNVINLTKTQGAGSLAHEWWHSMDYYFNREGDRRKTPATANTRAEMFNPGQRREIEDAFVDLMDKINGGDYFKRSVALEDKLHPNTLKTGYYDNPTELGARAFQDYVRRRLTDRGQVNDFLSSFTSEDKWNGEPETYPYPTGAEANEIDEKFDDLFATIQEKTDEAGNVLLYHKADSDVQPLSEVQGVLNEGLDEILGETIGSDYHTDLDEGQQKIMELGDNFHPQKVYHGSGADFDRFDSSHMGEGEGVQAYGYGHYTTEVEGIGRTYAEHYGKANVMMNGVPIRQVLSNEDYWDRQFANFVTGYERTINELKEAISHVYIDGRIAGPRSKRVRELEKQKKRLLAAIDNGEVTIDRGGAEPTLYTVDIPDDNGSNYLAWDKPIKQQDGLVERIADALAKSGFERTTRFEGDTDIVFAKDEKFIIIDDKDFRGEYLYKSISSALGSDKAASEFLHNAGFTGIKYPAQYKSGGRSDGASNYVIFDENDLKITDKVKFFRTQDGTAYGFTTDGQIYIDPRIATPETRIHEYAHLWAQGLKKRNPKAWKQLKSEMAKQKDVVAKVKEMYPELIDKNNPDELTDDMMEEVFAHYSGRRGAERLEADMREEMRKADGFVEKAQVANVFHKIKELLNKFWNMARDLFAEKFKGIEKLSGEDFADMALGDLLNKFDPRVENKERVKERDKEYMDAVERGDMETAQRMVLETAKAAMPKTKVVDENGMPLVVVHHTNGDFTKFDINRLGENSGDKGLYGAGFYFSTKGTGGIYGNREMEVYLNIRKPFEIDDYINEDTNQYTYFVEHFNIPELRELVMTENGKTITVGEYIDNIKSVDEEIAKSGVTAESLADDEELQYYRPQDRMSMYREHRITDLCGFLSLRQNTKALQQSGAFFIFAAAS